MKITIQSVQAATSLLRGTTGDMFLTSWSRYRAGLAGSLAYKSDGFYNAGKVKRPDVVRWSSRVPRS